MTEHIQHIIDEIRSKSQALHYQLNEEREKNTALQSELAVLNERLQSQKQKEEEFLSKENNFLSEIAALKMELDAVKSQVVENSNPVGRKDEEIDELVKEIEYCISQLKR